VAKVEIILNNDGTFGIVKVDSEGKGSGRATKLVYEIVGDSEEVVENDGVFDYCTEFVRQTVIY